MTVGSPLRRIVAFMIPLLIGNLFQQLYSMVDTVIVGQILGAAALSGVGSTGAVGFLILGFGSGLTQGFSIMVSQRRGARDAEGMRRSFATGIALTLVLISVLTVIASFAARPLLAAMHTKPEFFDYALEYISTIFAGMLLSALYNQFSSTLRAIGDSFMPLVFLIIASVLNGCMDCLFIMAFGLGVRGAALATVLSNGFAALLTFIYLWKRYPELRFSLRHFKPDLKLYAAHIKLGLPMALQMSVVSVGMIFGQTALNTMQPEMVTAYVAAAKIDGLTCSLLNSTGAAASTYVGQNYGAERFDRIKIGIKRLFALSVGMGIVFGGLVLALHRPLVMLFINKSELGEALLGYAFKYLLFNCGFYTLLSTLVISRSALQGMGRGALALSSAAAEVAMRVCFALIAMSLGSFTLVCALNCLSWTSANLILLPAFVFTLKKYIPLFGNNIKHMRMPNPSLPTNTEILGSAAQTQRDKQ